MSSCHSPALVIDLKYMAIRIHRSTLEALENPEYIELLVSPSLSTLAIRASSKTTTAQRINRQKLDTSQSIMLYSTPLVQNILNISPDWEIGCKYKMVGIAIPDRSMIVFEMRKARKIHEYEYIEDFSKT